ncbi:cyclic nucleotide-binding domain-containing protein [Polaromonas sp. JS666]|uniref:cyclic nucleotide-binding domain-containing protein n=1 Tax=Polaromonas sp. (strain JS666 / ATCC BAA-500) TaxID=296591 RepID=UPI000053309E
MASAPSPSSSCPPVCNACRLRQTGAFRYKTLSDGRRQILNFLLPGDLIGLQQKFSDGPIHGIEAVTDVTLCVFPPRWSLGAVSPISQPGL